MTTSPRHRCIDLAARLGLAVEDVLEYFTERAAIREVEGGAPRGAAEAGAWDDVRTRFDDVASDALLAGARKGPLARDAGVAVANAIDDADDDVG